MQDISKYIKELLIKNDTVILPGFGAFYSNYKEAHVGSDKKTLIPAKKEILFNPILKQNDGVLKDFVSKNMSIDQAEAEKIIRAYLENIRKELAQGKGFDIPELGKLKYDKKGKLSFTEAESTNLLLDGFGFEEIQLSPLEKTKGSKRKDQTSKPVKPKRNTKKIVLISTFVILVGAIGFLYWTQQSIFVNAFQEIAAVFKNPPIEMPAKKAPKKIVKSHVDSTALSMEMDIEQEEVLEEEETTKVQQQIEEQTDKKNALLYKEPETKLETKLHYLVAGSFQSKENAQGLLNKLRNKGYDSELLQGNGIWRVTFGSFNNKTVASKELQKIRQEYTDSSVWLLSL